MMDLLSSSGGGAVSGFKRESAFALDWADLFFFFLNSMWVARQD